MSPDSRARSTGLTWKAANAMPVKRSARRSICARLTPQCQCLTTLDVERHIIDSTHLANDGAQKTPSNGKDLAQMFHFQKRVAGHPAGGAVGGSSVHGRPPSPSPRPWVAAADKGSN